MEQMDALRQELDAAKSRALQRTKEVVASEEGWRARAEAAEAEVGTARLERDTAVHEMETMRRTFAAREAAAEEAAGAEAEARRAEVEEAAADAAGKPLSIRTRSPTSIITAGRATHALN